MRVGDVLEKTITIYRTNFPAFFTLFALLEIPFALLSLTFREVAAVQPRPLSPLTFPAAPVNSLAALAYVQVILLYVVLAGPLMEGAAVRVSLDAIAGRRADVRRSYHAAVALFWPLGLSTVLMLMAAAAGLALLIIPGILVILWFSLSTPAIMAEGLGPLAALRRSRELVSGNLPQVFALAVLLFVLIGLAGTVGGWLVATTLPAAAAPFADSLVTVLVSPFVSVAMAVAYVELRLKEV